MSDVRLAGLEVTSQVAGVRPVCRQVLPVAVRTVRVRWAAGHVWRRLNVLDFTNRAVVFAAVLGAVLRPVRHRRPAPRWAERDHQADPARQVADATSKLLT